MSHINNFIEAAKLNGRTNLHSCVTSLTRQIVGELHTTAEEKVIEIVRALHEFDLVYRDNSLPSDQEDATKRASATKTEAAKKTIQPQFTIDMSKVPPLVDRAWAEEVLRKEGVIID